MSDLTPEDEALIQQARAADLPTAEDRARVKGKLFAQIGVGIGASAISSKVGAAAVLTTGAGAAGGGSVIAVVAKVVAVVLVVGGAAWTGTWIARDSHGSANRTVQPLAQTAQPAQTPVSAGVGLVASSASRPVDILPTAGTVVAEPSVPTTSTFVVAVPLASPPAAIVRPSSPAPQPLADPSPQTAPALARAPTTTTDMTPTPALVATLAPPSPPSPSPARPLVPSAPPESGPASVAAEAELLRGADAAVKAGNPARAMALLHEHESRFPAGMLSEEREAERVVVLCALGRTDEARAAAAAFLRTRPRSPLAGRVRASCGGS